MARASTQLGHARVEYARARGYKSWAAYHRANPSDPGPRRAPKTRTLAQTKAIKRREHIEWNYTEARGQRKNVYTARKARNAEYKRIRGQGADHPTARYHSRETFGEALYFPEQFPKGRKPRKRKK